MPYLIIVYGNTAYTKSSSLRYCATYYYASGVTKGNGLSHGDLHMEYSMHHMRHISLETVIPLDPHF